MCDEKLEGKALHAVIREQQVVLMRRGVELESCVDQGLLQAAESSMAKCLCWALCAHLSIVNKLIADVGFDLVRLQAQMEADAETVGDTNYEHGIGDPECEQGWCDGGEFFPAECECGGLVHADFGDEDHNCEYWLYEKCDRCGDNYSIVGR